MLFVNQVKRLRNYIQQINLKESVLTEEATKQFLVIPMIEALGYNIRDPGEIVPEFTADVPGVRKREKVDYAILRAGQPAILIECKCWDVGLDESGHSGQLYRYFSVTSARIGILTNGLHYRVYTDLEEPNRMDGVPFLSFDLMNSDRHVIGEFEKLSKPLFNLDHLRATADRLKPKVDVLKRVSDIGGMLNRFGKKIQP